MIHRFRHLALMIALTCTTAIAARAQTDHPHLGAHALFNSSFDDFGLGAQFSAPVGHHWEFYPSFDYYFEDAGTMWEGNLDFKYRTGGQRSEWMYVGSGINYHTQKISNVTLNRAGWNLFGGVESLRGQIHPFAEARVTVTQQTRFQVQAGLNFTLGK